MNRLLISFSGGRTSAYMMWWIYNEWPDRDKWEKIAVFANTGKEAAGTLDFVDECSVAWGIPVVWVEGYPSEKGKGWKVEHKVVTYETASRNGEPFAAMISRLGIPSSAAPFCSDQLKKNAILSYLKSIGWGEHTKALGIRADEPKRLANSKKKKNVIYPFAHLYPVKNTDVIAWWERQDFNLEIHPDEGNCDGCWKKSFSVLYRIAQRNPELFSWWQEMTDKFGSANPRTKGVANNFYRGGLSPNDLISQSSNPSINAETFQRDLFCSESCEPF